MNGPLPASIVTPAPALSQRLLPWLIPNAISNPLKSLVMTTGDANVCIPIKSVTSARVVVNFSADVTR